MPHYDMSQLSHELGLGGRFFLTRAQGELAYERLLAHLQTLPVGQALVLVFPDQQLMDASFADEAVVRLGKEIVAGALGERAIILEGLTADSRLNLDAIIHLQRLKLAFLAAESNGAWQVVGSLEANLHETLQLVMQQQEMNAPTLAELLHLELNTASTRLKRLYDMHLLRREYMVSKKGLEYTYYLWEWTG